MTPPRSGASVRRAEQTVGGAAHNLPTKGCRALRRRRPSATPAGPPGTILWGQRRKASTRLVRSGHLERLRTQTSDLRTLFYKLRWGTREDRTHGFCSNSLTCTRTWCSHSRSSTRSTPRAETQGIRLKVVVFLAGALAPPWTALLADLFPVRSCLQVVKEMHKYAVRRQARTVESCKRREREKKRVGSFCF